MICKLTTLLWNGAFSQAFTSWRWMLWLRTQW